VFLPGPFSNEAPTGKAHLKQCEQMTLTRRQKRLCRREPGLAETLRDSVRLSLLECRYQFRNERWNCSLDGRGSLLKRGEPEPTIRLSSEAFTCSFILLYECTLNETRGVFSFILIPRWHEALLTHARVSEQDNNMILLPVARGNTSILSQIRVIICNNKSSGRKRGRKRGEEGLITIVSLFLGPRLEAPIKHD